MKKPVYEQIFTVMNNISESQYEIMPATRSLGVHFTFSDKLTKLEANEVSVTFCFKFC